MNASGISLGVPQPMSRLGQHYTLGDEGWGRGASPAKGQESNRVSAQNTGPRRIKEQDFALFFFSISTDDIKLLPAALFFSYYSKK